MSAAAPLPLAVPPPTSTSDPPVMDPPSSEPNAASAPPPVIPTASPPVIQSPPPVVIAAPPPATPPSGTQLPPPSVIAPPPLTLASSPPPPPPTSSPPPPTPPSKPQESSPHPPLIPPPPSSPASESPITSPPPPASTPTKSSPTPDPPPPPNTEQPRTRTSPPPPRKSPPTTSPPPTPLPEGPSVNPPPPPPPEPITPRKTPPSPNSTPPSQPSLSPKNSSTNSTPPTVIHMAPPPSVISSPSLNSNLYVPENSNSTGNIGTNAAVAVGIGVSFGVIALSLIILIIWCVFKRKKEASLNGRYIMPSSNGSSPKADSTLKVNSSSPLLQSVLISREHGGLGHTRSWFAYEELVVATNGFSPKNLLGEGGFGDVYKGYLPDGRIVAVKQLRIGGGQGEREFKAEVELISRIHHRHLVSLVGYCVADTRRLLVYEYVPNDTLYFHLHGEGGPPMIWATRVKAAAGAARGLAYLHEDCHPRIIHRDIKSSNILLNNNFDARVSDFGLAKLALDASSHVTTRVMGTFGYMAPEYASSGKLTEKSDVYSFGVVLLELITGRKPVDASRPTGDESLVEWARPLLGHAIETAEFGSLVDPRLETNFVDVEMFRMIEAAAACVRHSANKRPTMGQVVRFFDSLLASDITNGMRMGHSQVYDSAEHSAEIKLFRKMAFGSQNYNSDSFSDDSQLHDDTRRLENGSTFSDHYNETTHILEVDSDNQTTEVVSHLHS